MQSYLLIKIVEEYSELNKKEINKIKIKTDDKHEIIFDNYPIRVTSKNFEYIQYEVQKKKDHSKNHNDKNDGVLDKAKEKALTRRRIRTRYKFQIISMKKRKNK